MPEINTLNHQNGCHAEDNKSCCKGVKKQSAVDANNNGVEAEGCCTKKNTTGVQYSNGKETTPYQPVTHVIFDLDGLLIDSEQRFANAISILLKRFGIAEYSKELQEKVLGMEVARGIEEIIKSTGIPITVAEFMVMEREIYSEEMLKVELMPGVHRLVEHLKRHRIPMAIATGSTLESYLIKTKRHQDLFTAGKYFQHIVFTRDDAEVKRPKPAPDVYLITARRFADSPAPSNCLVFEDSHIGVDGARAAGMQCVMVPDHRFTCKQENATQVLYSLEHFQPQLYGLPPYDQQQ